MGNLFRVLSAKLRFLFLFLAVLAVLAAAGFPQLAAAQDDTTGVSGWARHP